MPDETSTHLGGVGEEGNARRGVDEAASGCGAVVEGSSQRLSQIQLTCHVSGQQRAAGQRANLIWRCLQTFNALKFRNRLSKPYT